MLGGVRDEVVPRSQMQELWAIIRDRGRDTANKKEDVRAGSSGSRPEPTPATGSGSGSDDRTVPPKIVDGGNTYIEFPDGTHSELCLLKSLVAVSCSLRLCR
jgi:hypothetical protein